MKQVKVSDQHTAESLSHFSMEKGDLVMADAGYGTAQNYIYAQEQGVDVILRITPKCFCLYDANGEKLSLTALLEEAEETHMEWIDVFGLCRYRGSHFSVRLWRLYCAVNGLLCCGGIPVWVGAFRRLLRRSVRFG